MRTPPYRLTWRHGRLGCVGGPWAIAASIALALIGAWVFGLLFAPGLTADEATAILRMHAMNQATARANAEAKAAGLARPDRAILERLSEAVQQARTLRVRRVQVRPELLWTFHRQSRCVARMELDADPTQAPVVRYYRTVCTWLLAPRIIRETTASDFRFPL